MVRQPIEHLVDGIKLVFNGLQLLIKDSLKIILRSVKNNNAWHGCALYTTPLSSTDRKAGLMDFWLILVRAELKSLSLELRLQSRDGNTACNVTCQELGVGVGTAAETTKDMNGFSCNIIKLLRKKWNTDFRLITWLEMKSIQRSFVLVFWLLRRPAHFSNGTEMATTRSWVTGESSSGNGLSAWLF
ncbi:hypothetical protein FOXB_04237 [Fusarium oxysporum f. sp. conglutinans Fo5176]|uniref:Uncharacterized protein n=1 Tax=Fusarium oxysporum (strain Fo5176) TaxID=660025 RepID=F9FCV9_FUSOF|nr:hypothetical protein FOXB_04237 [Fusarium oxysporum f. sp. conglutinans Fo5176]